MIKILVSGDWKKTETFLKNCSNLSKSSIINILENAGKKGIEMLQETTPKRTGLTAASWTYNIENLDGGYRLSFDNTNVHDGCNVAILLQYGHGTGWGGYVEGEDYINPIIRPLFDEITDEIVEEVNRS